jgi:LmbE family N-acetylglucosaminyl deacetylase
LVGYPEDEITTVIDIRQFLHVKLRALRCHATQYNASNEAEEMHRAADNPLYHEETFTLARSEVGWPDGTEVDLFRGIRG